jgi:hypothetical protein
VKGHSERSRQRVRMRLQFLLCDRCCGRDRMPMPPRVKTWHALSRPTGAVGRVGAFGSSLNLRLQYATRELAAT